MSVFSAYKYLFYRTYRWQLEMFGEGENPKFVGIFANTMCVFFNLMTLLVWFQILTGYKLRVESVHAVMGGVIFLSINSFIFLYNNKSDTIIAEFASESEIQRKRRTIWCWIYVFATYASFFGSVLILSPGSAK